MTSCSLIMDNDDPPSIRVYTIWLLYYRSRPFTELYKVCVEHFWRFWHTDRERSVFRAPVPSYFGLAYFLFVETNLFPELVVFFLDFAIRTSNVIYSILFLFLDMLLDSAVQFLSTAAVVGVCSDKSHGHLLAERANAILIKHPSSARLSTIYIVTSL